MVIDQTGYIELIQYLTDNLSIFEQKSKQQQGDTLAELVSEQISENIMRVCLQHEHLDSHHRFEVVRETDAIVHDLEEVLSNVWESVPTEEQAEFINEFVGLLKNLFDSALCAYD